jgi:hypothetical protein
LQAFVFDHIIPPAQNLVQAGCHAFFLDVLLREALMYREKDMNI